MIADRISSSAFSIVRQIPERRLVPNVAQVCGSVSFAEYDVPGSIGLSEKIALKFGEGHNVVMLENHGVFVGATDIFKAFMAFETFDFCARLEIEARKVGKVKALTDAQIALSKEKQHSKMDEFVNKNINSEERASRRDMCKLIKRSYQQQLFTSTQGTFSQRLSDGTFLITPYHKDRKYLEPEDIVKIHGDWCEAGKLPSRSVMLHKRIYDDHPEINSIILAH
jgi:L-fuculose-phosphate aldolase